MATSKQREAARKNVKKAQAGAREKKSISSLSKETRPSADRVSDDNLEIVRLDRAPAWAFLTFLRAVSRCF